MNSNGKVPLYLKIKTMLDNGEKVIPFDLVFSAYKNNTKRKKRPLDEGV